MKQILILLLLGCSQIVESLSAQTNVVFIIVDDLGWKDLGCYGSEFYDTPNLDALAARSIQFTHAYAASPVCSPTRAAIQTGKHPVRVNITDWIPGMPIKYAENPLVKPPEDIHNLPLDELTLAEAFQAQGYLTFFAGKWHLGETPAYWPEHQGYETNVGGTHRGSPTYPEGKGYYSPYNNPRMTNGPVGEYLTDRLTDESLHFLEEAQEKPFFLFLSYYSVHTPIQGCEAYDSLYQAKKLLLPNQGESIEEVEGPGITQVNQNDPKYAAMVRSVDRNVGRVVEKLEELGLMEETIIVFTSDNGGLSTLKKAGPTSVRPLRAGKGWCYEGGIRIPTLIYTPNLIKRGVSCASPITSMDFYPTLLEWTGLPLLPKQHLDGRSLGPLLHRPDQVWERTLVWHFPHYHGSMWRPGSAIRQGKYKYVYFYEQEVGELYDLESDIGEQKDLSETHPGITQNLHTALFKSLKEMGGSFPSKQ